MDEKSRAFIFGERLKDAPEIPQMTKEQMEECINETEKYIPKTFKNDLMTVLRVKCPLTPCLTSTPLVHTTEETAVKFYVLKNEKMK